jgi:hypothetical protein
MSEPVVASPNMKFLGRTDQGGRPDGVQIIVERGHAFIGHMESNGISVVDVADPRHPRCVNFLACPPRTRSNHLQVGAGLMLAVNAADKTALAEWRRQNAAGQSASRETAGARPFTAGLRVFDLSRPAAPREIGFCPIAGVGLHRLWWTGGRFAYASAHFDGYADHILAIFDMSDPAAPRLAGRWSLPGMNLAAGETPGWPNGKRWALHHMIVAGDLGYSAWRDGGFTIHDLSNPIEPVLLSHRVLSPPFSGSTHTPLPLPGRGLAVVADEPAAANCADGVANVWIFDVREPRNPISFATLPQPREADYCAVGGKFGPHNLHENRPGLFQSETLIFATWNNAGVRAFDISDPFRPRQVGYCVPARPERIVAPQSREPLVTQSSDVCVDREGRVYVTDNNGGLSILQFEGT